MSSSIAAAHVTGVTKMKLPGFEPRGAVLVDFDFSGMPIRIIGAHLGLLASSRARQAEAIIGAAHPVDDRAVILLGDTNEWRVGGRSALRPFDPHLLRRRHGDRQLPLALSAVAARPGADQQACDGL